jgi:hypothetical protein
VKTHTSNTVLPASATERTPRMFSLRVVWCGSAVPQESDARCRNVTAPAHKARGSIGSDILLAAGFFLPAMERTEAFCFLCWAALPAGTYGDIASIACSRLQHPFANGFGVIMRPMTDLR